MDKKGHKELLIIMPAYNEEKNIGKVLEQLERAGVSLLNAAHLPHS